jgi:TonB-dependent receptor
MTKTDQSPSPLRKSAVTLAVLAALQPAAFAQTQEAPTSEPAASQTIKTIVIRGFRTQNTRSIANKEASVLTVDSVAADEVGSLPDFNVGDALKRVTGVNTLEYQGEPRFVIVRGLNANYNTTLIDGFAFATADIGSRQILMEVLPSNFIHRIDVTKTFLPEVDGASIGGVSNLVTAGGFDHPDGVLTLQAKGGVSLMNSRYGGNKPAGEASAKWGVRFGAAKEFAFLGTASYWQRHIQVPQIESGGSLNWYNADGTRNSAPYSGNGIAVPTERRWYNYDNDRDRTGLTTRLDWQPEGRFRGHVATYYFKQREASDRATQNAQVQSSGRVSNATPTSGTLSNVNQYVELGRLRWDRALYGVNGELKAELVPTWHADLRASLSRSTVSNPQTWDQFQQNGLAFNYDWSGPTPTFSGVDPATTENPARYANVYHREEGTEYAQRVSDLQFNLRHRVEEEDRGLGFAAGARLVATRMDTAFLRRTWNAMPYSLADVLAGSTCGFNCNTALYTIDPERADALWAANRVGVTPVDDTTNQNANTYGFKENVQAAYAQAQWRSDRWLVAGGLRFEHTEFAGESAGVSTERSYSNMLPSVAGFYTTGARSKLRFGLSRTLGRPRPDQMILKDSRINATARTITQSNPELKPRRSDNIDLGHDWVLDGGRSMVGVALFQKHIRDEIFRYGALQTIDGAEWTVIQPRNAEGKVKITGIELGVIKELGGLMPALTGFTASVNATVLDVKYPVKLGDGTATTLNVLPEQAKELWNLALTYEHGPWHAKLAWNRTGKLWDDRFPNYDSQAQFYRNRYQQARDKVDLKVAYDVSRNLSLTFDVFNLTGEGFQYNIGRSQEYVQSAWKVAPIVMLGVNMKL